jgi:hypothetical protein
MYILKKITKIIQSHGSDPPLLRVIGQFCQQILGVFTETARQVALTLFSSKEPTYSKPISRVKIRGSIAEVEYLGWEELQIQML